VTSSVYGPRTLKRSRPHSSKDQMATFYDALIAIVNEQPPMTVRQAFYQAEVKGLVKKGESGYRKVLRGIVKLRRSGRLSHNLIVDNTRWQRKDQTYSSPGDMVAEAGLSYRQSVWAKLPLRIEVWCEKDALAGVLLPVTRYYDVPLLVARGYCSETFAYEAAMDISECWEDDLTTFVYHLGDFDPSGAHAAYVLNETLYDHAPEESFYFERLGVSPDQINRWTLSTRPTNKKDPRYDWFCETYPGWGDTSCDLDAVAPNTLRVLVQTVIESHLPPGWMDKIKAEEDLARQSFQWMMDQINGHTQSS
jgi:hypothetical protein